MTDFRSTFEDEPDTAADHRSPWPEDEPHPETWPRRAEERYQPRSRLHQALDVAQRIIETPQDPWARAATPAREQLMAGATEPWREPTLFNGLQAAEPATAAKAAADTPTAAPETRPATTLTDPADVAEPPTTEEPIHMVVDLRPTVEKPPLPARPTADYGLGNRWGAAWHAAAQGWVRTADGGAAWRPVVATTDDLPKWDIGTYLGVVTAEVAVEAHGGDFRQLGATLARGRQVGMDGLVEEAIERGAHAVIGVDMTYTPIGERLLITITGTAVTLRQRQQ